MTRGALALVAATAALAVGSSPVQAGPEVNANLAVLYGRRASGGADEGLFGLDLHAGLLGDRESPRGFAAGAAVHVGVTDFDEAHAAAGAALLLPVLESFPIVLEAAPLVTVDANGLHSGALGRLFWGVHPLPRFGAYVVTVGLALEARWIAPDRVELLAGLDIDAFALLWPWMFLWEAL